MESFTRALPVILLALLLAAPAAASPGANYELAMLQQLYSDRDLEVEASTRHPKHISKVSENISVVTSEEIEAMNAHTVGEVLERVTGLFTVFTGRDFGSIAHVKIQGSERRHVLLLIDGVKLNYLSEGVADTTSVPVQIIKRIEIIKGPASASWGSSLGGIVNIITKDTGHATRPTGLLSASFGEGGTADLRGDIAGRTGNLGYYLFSGHQRSNGLISSREFDNTALYAKMALTPSPGIDLGMTFGYSSPDVDYGDYTINNLNSRYETSLMFVTGSLEASLSTNLSFSMNFSQFYQDGDQSVDFLTPRELYKNSGWDEELSAANVKFVLERKKHTVVLGMEYEIGKVVQTLESGALLMAWGVPPTMEAHPEREKWALFLNDSISLGRLCITPGIRYDHDDISGDFVSPSLGLSYELGQYSILRASVARGFTSPPLAYTSGGGAFLDPNPSLEEEKVWSYQAGIETKALSYLWLRSTLFHHDMENALVKDYFVGGPPSYNDMYNNRGKISRRGAELEIRTIPMRNFVAKAGLAYSHIKEFESAKRRDIYTIDLGLVYDDGKYFRGELFGHYIDPDDDDHSPEGGYDFIWDINMNRKLSHGPQYRTELFFSAHNIFNGSHYDHEDMVNPGRWVEAGLKLRY